MSDKYRTNYAPKEVPFTKFYPEWAKIMGLRESLMLASIHFRLDPGCNQNYIDGKHWVYDTYEDWVHYFKGLWTYDEVRNTFDSLRAQNLIIVEKKNSQKWDQTNWYTINFDRTDIWNKNDHDVQKSEENSSWSADTTPSGQIVHDSKNLGKQQLVPRTKSSWFLEPDRVGSQDQISYTKNTTKNTTKTDVLARAREDETTDDNEMIKIWNEEVSSRQGDGAIVRSSTPLVNRLNSSIFGSDIEKWRKFCQKVASNPFLIDKNHPKKKTAWTISIQWALDHCSDILHGVYDSFSNESTEDSAVKLAVDESHLSENPTENDLKKVALTLFGKESYVSWIDGLKLQTITNGCAVFKAASSFVKGRIEAMQMNYQWGKILAQMPSATVRQIEIVV